MKLRPPFKYFVICNKTKDVLYETNQPPILRDLQSYVEIPNTNTFELKQTKTAYIDTRYEAKLRLFNYVNYTKKGLQVPRYNPLEGTEIGKSLPILPF